MSDNYLVFIPTNPDYIPTPSAQEKARQLLASSTPHADNVTCQVTDEIRFIDAGINSGKIVCPFCHLTIDEDWWLESIDTAYENSQFQILEVVVPCCGRSVSLNHLQYDWPVGFARFSLEVRNPGHDIDNNVKSMLEEILDCRLTKIWRHL